MRLFTLATSAQLISGYATAPSKQVFWNFLTDAESPAPQIYKNIMYDYLFKVETVQNAYGAEFPQTFANWEALADSGSICQDEAVLSSLNKGLRIACRVVNCIEGMSHVTFANPAGEVCDDIKACLMMTGDTESKKEFDEMCQRPDWKNGLNQVLTAVAVLDANPHNSLDDINSLFGCDNSCVFDNGYVINMYQQGVSVVDDTNCPTNIGLRSLEQSISDQANRKTGIITDGFIIPKMISSEHFKPFNNRGLETITEGPSVDSFHEIMSMATAGSSLAVWDAATDEANAAYCTVNQCLACLTDVQSKIVITALPDGRTSSECVCPAAVKDHDRDGTANDLTTFIDYTELAQPIYAQVVLDYFTNWELSPADPSGDPGPEKFRTEELKWIAAALSDLPAPTGTSTSIPLSQAEYMTRTRGLVIKHLMQKIYEKGDLEFTTRVQGAIDEDSFRHNLYFILETLYTAEQEIRWSPQNSGRPTADIDFSVLNNFHVESSGFSPHTPPDTGLSETATIDWEMGGNTDAYLSEAYMDQILSGLNGGDPLNTATDQFTTDVVIAVKGSYTNIFERTSELTDCANKDKVDIIEWICDERIDEAVWMPCQYMGIDECWLAAGDYVCGLAEAEIDTQGPDTPCPCDRTLITRCNEGAQLLTDESNWHNMHRLNPLYAAWGKQWIMDMASFYSSDGSLFNQAEMCALEQAIAEAMAVGAAGGENGVRNFEYNFAGNVRNYINSDAGGFDYAFGDKVSDLISIANSDGRNNELEWLIATARDLSNGYGYDWRGDAIQGEGHGSPQYFELYNLIHTMRNDGNWDVLGMPMGPDGNSFVGFVDENNDGTGGNWENFSAGDQDAWIATLNSDIMGMSWVADNSGPNNKYQENYDQLFGYLEPGPTGPPMYTTSRPNGCFGKSIGFCGIDPADLEHASCLMDEQLNMIDNFFVSKNIHPVMAQFIKDEAKQFLNDNAFNGYGQNPNMVNWFYGSLEDLKYMMDLILGTVAYPIATDISNEQDFVTLLAQLQLMDEVGNPEFKHQLSKDEFKNIDFNSVVPAGTTGQTIDAIQVLSDLTVHIEQATGEAIDPTLGSVIQAAADKTSTEGVTYFDNRTPGYTATTAVNTAPPATATTEQPPVDDGLNAADCAGTVDYKFRSGKAKVSRSGENSNLVRLQQAKVKETKAHTGFVSFPKSACGKDFLAGLKDGRVTVDFADKKATYSVIGSYYVDNGSSTQVVVQYNSVPLNVADDKCPKCLGNSSTDQLEMLVMGTKNIEWGSKTAKACLNGALVGHAGAAGAPTLLENDESGCVAWTNAL